MWCHREQEVESVNDDLLPAGPANEENFFEWEALIMWVHTHSHTLTQFSERSRIWDQSGDAQVSTHLSTLQ